MKYVNYNPELNSDLLESAGFHFDGYYWHHEGFGANLVIKEGGYGIEVEGVDKQVTQGFTLKNYSDLFRQMLQLLPKAIDKVIGDGKFLTSAVMQKAVVDKVNELFKFDEDVEIFLAFHPNGLQVRPHNEYTFSLASGRIERFKIEYTIESTGEMCVGLLECDPNCICYNYLIEFAAKESVAKLSDIRIKSCSIYVPSPDGRQVELPFFGTGIPKIQKR